MITNLLLTLTISLPTIFGATASSAQPQNTAESVTGRAYRIIVKTDDPSPETVDFDKVMKLSYPPTPEFRLDESYGALTNTPAGMAIIEFDAAENVTVNTNSKAKVQLYSGDTLLSEINTKDPEDNEDGTGIASTGINIFDEGEIEFGRTNSYMLKFSATAAPQFTAEGNYTVRIPEGTFFYGEEPVAETVINFTLLPPKTEWAYTITPESNSEMTGTIPSITLSIDGVITLDYNKNVGKLYAPDESIHPFISAWPKLVGRNAICWTPVQEKGWMNGTYRFVIEPKTIAINGWIDEGVEPTFPESEIVVLYIVTSATSGVRVTGIGHADAYTVSDTSGRLLLLNGTAEELTRLDSGIYIINGKKACIRK